MNTKCCDRCGNPDCPRVSKNPYWRVCPHASTKELARAQDAQKAALARAARVNTARSALRAALSACPHWDFEQDGAGHPCCDAVQAARSAYAAAKES